jgi:hypothetical protein
MADLISFLLGVCLGVVLGMYLMTEWEKRE